MIEQVVELAESADTPSDQYDSPWKEAVEHYFPEFMEFYFPNAHVEIDWAKDYIFLDKGCGPWCRMPSWEPALLTSW